MRKNAHAVALGKLGGQARNKSVSQADKVRIAKMGGRPSKYIYNGTTLARLNGGRWAVLEPPYDDAAKAYLRRLERSR